MLKQRKITTSRLWKKNSGEYHREKINVRMSLSNGTSQEIQRNNAVYHSKPENCLSDQGPTSIAPPKETNAIFETSMEKTGNTDWNGLCYGPCPFLSPKEIYIFSPCPLPTTQQQHTRFENRSDRWWGKTQAPSPCGSPRSPSSQSSPLPPSSTHGVDS